VARKQRRKPKWQPERAVVGELDRHGRAIVPAAESGRPRAAHVDGALPGEVVELVRTEREGPIDGARTLGVIEPSPQRIEARCRHYGVCGGCSLMHLSVDAQVAFKQRVLLEDFERHGVVPERVLEPLRGPSWAYRRRARLGAKLVHAKAKVLVGFREKDRRFIADLSGCEVLAGPASGPLSEQPGRVIDALSQLIASLSIAARTPQIEVTVADDELALVLRVLDPPSAEDLAEMHAFARDWQLRMYLQPGGPDSVVALDTDRDPLLRYSIPEFELEIAFLPTDFVQVNAAINREMISRAIALLELEPSHRVLDLFCGLGNFSLPIARRAAAVVGIEGDAGLVERARANAAANGLRNVEFMQRDLYRDVDLDPRSAGGGWTERGFDRVLLDPPRSGAAAIVENFAPIAAPRVVYVACSPETLARDAATLISRHGYRLLAAGVMDMFPHTAHVESIAVFARGAA
jgi:23S rRNA (uracil1939-C5)-methyltransferase